MFVYFGKKDTDNVKREVAEVVYEFGANVSVHGIRWWLSRDYKCLFRLLNFVIFLLFISYTTYLLWQNVARYKEYNIKVTFTEGSVDSLVFPSITICPTSTYAASAVGGSKFTQMGLYQAQRPDLPPAPCFNAALEDINAFDMSYWDGGRKIRDPFQQWLIPLHRFFKQCTLALEKVDCGDLFFGHWTTSGRCFTYNFDGRFASTERSLVWIFGNLSSEVKTVKKAGIASGLRLRLDFAMDEYCAGPMDDNLGFRVLIHDPIVLPPFMEGSFLVSPGLSTEMVVTVEDIIREKVKNLGHCEDRELDLFPGLNYTRDNCILECLAHKVFQSCGCLITFSPMDPDFMAEILLRTHPEVKPAPPAEDLFVPCFGNGICQADIIKRYASGELPECEKDCQDSCRTKSFSARVSSVPFISHANIAQLKNMTGYQSKAELEANVAELNIYFARMQLRQVVESWDFVFFDLVSNLGGTLGLFLGASMFSFVEIVEFLGGLIAILINTKILGSNKVPTAKREVTPVEKYAKNGNLNFIIEQSRPSCTGH